MTLKVVNQARTDRGAELRDPSNSRSRVAKHVKSNTIVYAKDRATVGIGAGQMSRVDFPPRASLRVRRRMRPMKLGAHRADDQGASVVCVGRVLFRLPMGLLVAIEAGATAVIQPGGSIRDGRNHQGRR